MLSTRNENEVWVQSGVVCLIVSFRVFGLVTTTIANVRERRERIGDERANIVRRPSFPARLPRYELLISSSSYEDDGVTPRIIATALPRVGTVPPPRGGIRRQSHQRVDQQHLPGNLPIRRALARATRAIEPQEAVVECCIDDYRRPSVTTVRGRGLLHAFKSHAKSSPTTFV